MNLFISFSNYTVNFKMVNSLRIFELELLFSPSDKELAYFCEFYVSMLKNIYACIEIQTTHTVPKLGSR